MTPESYDGGAARAASGRLLESDRKAKPMRTVYDDLKEYWWLLLISGLFSIVVGGALVLWPGKTLTVVGFLIGLWMLIVGIIRFLTALFGGEPDGRWVVMIVGVVGIVLGIVVMRNPAETIGIIVLIAAIFWIISGLIDLFRGITNEDLPARGWVVFGGVVAVATGTIVLLWPKVSIAVLAIIAGVFFIIDGVLAIVASFQIKKA